MTGETGLTLLLRNYHETVAAYMDALEVATGAAEREYLAARVMTAYGRIKTLEAILAGKERTNEGTELRG